MGVEKKEGRDEGKGKIRWKIGVRKERGREREERKIKRIR